MSLQKPVKCNLCAAPIYFDNAVLSVSGKKIPLDASKPGEKHNCPMRKQTYVGLGDEKPEETAHKQVQQEFANKAQPNGQDQRSADIKKLHDENMTASKELASAILVLANEVQGIKHLLEVYVKTTLEKDGLFQTASTMKGAHDK